MRRSFPYRNAVHVASGSKVPHANRLKRRVRDLEFLEQENVSVGDVWYNRKTNSKHGSTIKGVDREKLKLTMEHEWTGRVTVIDVKRLRLDYERKTNDQND